jgi:hypothetical protein
MDTTTEITKVTCRWDDQAGVTPGWYCESYKGDEMADDSQKVWFPVDVEDYSQGQRSELRTALKEAFPGADITFN